MAELTYPSLTGRGISVFHTERIVVDADGKAWIVSGSLANHGVKPLDDGELAAVKHHLGKKWDALVAAAKALA